MPSPLDSHWTTSHFPESSPSPVDYESSHSPLDSTGVQWIQVIPVHYCLLLINYEYYKKAKIDCAMNKPGK
ncbi:uncharacterized protein LACBIDRAFT_308482 [Laccaria bicolor S238N-H82]|uniref:Predicted protein n=1 Tax=Laccaria bicolor (strain S238N-H82 / ATCC MYA-4686) TaxID=486041 RepID=B0CWE7_LACBS|nr:uncharacterized protein LACBIDRAFT_308482 [Laccaria bicolor S238N-H82]EDR13497.1 predicted protein [Laccaria bicolor S238N-H82]|eukprot:XP_001875995.1 predicted protein [Laccaria bicolor S238N-H82]